MAQTLRDFLPFSSAGPSIISPAVPRFFVGTARTPKALEKSAAALKMHLDAGKGGKRGFLK